MARLFSLYSLFAIFLAPNTHAYAASLSYLEQNFINNIRHGHVENVKESLQQEVNVNIQIDSKSLITPLHLAAQGGNMEIVRLLLSNGANPTASDSKGFKPYHSAAYYGHITISSMLAKQVFLKDSMGRPHMVMSPLHKAVEAGHLDIVMLLLSNGADINSKNSNGETVLHVAARTGHQKIVKLLLDKKVALHTKDHNGESPLHSAVDSGKLSIVDILLQAGANIDVNDNYGETPLHLAVMSGNPELVTILLENGADPNKVGRN